LCSARSWPPPLAEGFIARSSDWYGSFLLDYPCVPGLRQEARHLAFVRSQFSDLKLELSQDKTLTIHARTGAARFLGYEITIQHADRKITRGRRTANGSVALRVPGYAASPPG
jgi:hypothetical protein